MKLAVIIVTYNGKEWIRKCLDSLYNDPVVNNIYVIDNASSDDTVAIIEQHYPLVNLTCSKTNLGFGQANNAGIKEALANQADYIFLLNQDAWLGIGCLSKLLTAAVARPDVGIAAPFQLDYMGEDIEHYFNDYVIGQYTPAYINDLYKGQLSDLYISQFIHAAGWLMPAQVVKEVGGFDPLFFHYGEDNDYVQRLVEKKYRVGFVPAAIMCHHGTNEGLADPSNNIRHKINFAILHLKDPKGSMAGSTLVFFKRSFDAISSAIIYRKWASLKAETKVFAAVFKQLKKISGSRKEQQRAGAYLH